MEKQCPDSIGFMMCSSATTWSWTSREEQRALYQLISVFASYLERAFYDPLHGVLCAWNHDSSISSSSAYSYVEMLRSLEHELAANAFFPRVTLAMCILFVVLLAFGSGCLCTAKAAKLVTQAPTVTHMHHARSQICSHRSLMLSQIYGAESFALACTIIKGT